MKYDIITFGSAVIDTFIDTNPEERKGNMLYPVGAKILVKEFRFQTGGGGTNTAVGFSRLGLKTGCIGKVGKDCDAGLILDELKREKVDFLGKVGSEITGHSIILDSKEHDRTVLTYKGENDKVDFEDIRSLNTKWIHFSAAIGKSFDTQEKVAKYCKKKGIMISLNPSLYQIKDLKSRMRRLMKDIDILILNKEEAEALAGKGDLFLRLKKLGAGIVCITDGKNGAKVYDGIYLYNIGTKKVKVIETTGAGDAFSCGFITGMIKKGDIEFAMQLGISNSESVIKEKGAKNKLLNWNESIRYINKNQLKVERKLI